MKAQKNPNTNHPELVPLKCSLLRCTQKMSPLRLLIHQDYARDALCHHVSAANCSFVPGSTIAIWNNAFALTGLNCWINQDRNYCPAQRTSGMAEVASMMCLMVLPSQSKTALRHWLGAILTETEYNCPRKHVNTAWSSLVLYSRHAMDCFIHV